MTCNNCKPKNHIIGLPSVEAFSVMSVSASYDEDSENGEVTIKFLVSNSDIKEFLHQVNRDREAGKLYGLLNHNWSFGEGL